MFKKLLLLGLIFSLVLAMIGCTPTPRPDLEVLNIGPPDVNCNGVCDNFVTFTIANTGLADAAGFEVLVQGDPGLAQTEIVPVVGLVAGSTKTFSIPLPAGGNCFDPDCTICVTVDSLNEIVESDEGNNNYCETTAG